MKRALLELAVRASAAARPFVLARALGKAHQFALDADGVHGAGAKLPAQLLEEARAALERDGARTVEVAGEAYLLQTLSPAARLILIGAVHIAQKLAPMARLAGFAVLLIDPRPAFATPERFPDTEITSEWPQEVLPRLQLTSRTALVTLSHDAKIDEPALAAALRSEAFYIGALGSKKNHAKRLTRLADRGFDDAALARISGPIGLPLGGRSPAEIAVAILAEIIQRRYRGSAG